MGGKGGGGSTADVVYVVLERGVAMDLLNALYIALGIIPGGGTKTDQGEVKAGGSGKVGGSKTAGAGKSGGGGKGGSGKGGGKSGGGVGGKSIKGKPGGSGKGK